MIDDRTPQVKEISQLHLDGHIIPHSWYRHIRKILPNNKTKPDFWAIALLSDIVYWYRHSVTMEESTGEITALRKKFRADFLQKRYKDYADMFAAPEKAIKDSFKTLASLGVLKLHMRHVKLENGRTACNVMYIEPIPETISYINDPSNQPLFHISNKEDMESENVNKNQPPKSSASVKNDPDGLPSIPKQEHGVHTPQKGYINTKDYLLDLSKDKSSLSKSSSSRTGTKTDSDLLELFTWAKSLSIHFNNICPTSFSVPSTPNTKRMKNLLKHLHSLQSGKISSYTWDQQWIESNKIPGTGTLSQFKGKPIDEIKAAVYKAGRRYAKAKSDSKYWYPGNRSYKLSLDEFIYNFNTQLGMEGQSQFLYWINNTPTLRHNTAYSEQILKSVNIKMSHKSLAKVCFPRDAQKIEDWSDIDERDFLMSASRMINWYTKNQSRLSEVNQLWGVHLSTIMELFRKLGTYYDEGGWMSFPRLPYPEGNNPQWVRFVNWMKEDYHVNLNPGGNGSAKTLNNQPTVKADDPAAADIIDGIWKN